MMAPDQQPLAEGIRTSLQRALEAWADEDVSGAAEALGAALPTARELAYL
jgi:hypothetical protein